MTGRLVLPETRQRTPRFSEPMPGPECDLCDHVLGRVTCQRGQRDIRVMYDGTTSSSLARDVYYVVKPQMAEGKLYAFTLIVDVDSTIWQDAAGTALQIARHLMESRDV